MRDHRFRIGQVVRLSSRVGLSPAAADTYRIVAMMPPRDSSPQYRLRNDETRQERVATEDDLELCDDINLHNDNDN